MQLLAPTPQAVASVVAAASTALGKTELPITVSSPTGRKPVEFGGFSWRYVISDDGEVVDCLAA